MKKSLFGVVSVAAIAVGSMISGTALALPAQAQSIIYFDSNDNIIGQQILFCTNSAVHAGNIDSSNQNKIIETVSCKGTGNAVLGITYFHSATGKSTTDYCDDAHPAGTPFFGAPPCNLPQPDEDLNLGPFLSGWM